MRLKVVLRWVAFLAYFFVLLALPPSLLWGFPGLIAGGWLAVSVLLGMRMGGTKRISENMQVRPLTSSQAPAVHAITAEYCRRLQLPVPRIGLIDTPGVNCATYGFSSHDLHLVFTQGLLDKMTRPQLAAVIARALCRVRNGEVPNETWLTRLLDILQRLVSSHRPRRTRAHDALALRTVVRQVLLYPLTQFPAFVLKGTHDDLELDRKAVRLCRDPVALAEAFRKMEALAERHPYHAPFSTRHLFLATPPSRDPLTRVFFHSVGFNKRIRVIEGRQLAAAPT